MLIVSTSSGIPMMGQLLDVMSEAIELPLPLHLAVASQGEAIKSLVSSQVAEHRLHGGKAPSDHLPAELRIDPRLHPVGVSFVSLAFALEERYLPGLRLLGHAQTLEGLGADMARNRAQRHGISSPRSR